MSQEYIGAIVILLISLFKIFKVELASDEVTAIVTGAVAIWVAVRRFKKGDITVVGSRK